MVVFKCQISLKKDKDKKRVTRMGDEYPLFLFVKFGTQKTYIGITKLIKDPLKTHYTEEEFEKISSIRTIREIKDQQIEYSRFEEGFNQMILQNDLRTLKEVKEFIKNRGNEINSTPKEVFLGSRFDLKIQEKIDKKKSEDEYKTTKNHIDRFIKSKKKGTGIDTFPLRFVNGSFVEELKDFLSKDPINKSSTGKSKVDFQNSRVRSQSTINTYLREFRSVLKSSSINCEKWFSGCDRKIPQTGIRVIQDHELVKLFNYQTDDELKRWSVNILLLTYFFQGCNLIDLINLKTSNLGMVNPDQSKDYFVEFYRTKTKDNVKESLPLTIYLDTEKMNVLLEFFHFNPQIEVDNTETYLFNLSPPNVDLKFKEYHNGSITSTILSQYWNKSCSHYLKLVFSELNIPKKGCLKVVRKTTVNKVESVRSNSTNDVDGWRSEEVYLRYYQDLDNRIQKSKRTFEGLYKILTPSI